MDYNSSQKKVPVPFPFNGRATFEVIHGYSRVWIVIDSVKLLQPKNHMFAAWYSAVCML